MSLREQQDLLVRLYTDADFAAGFFEDPEAVKDVQNVSQDEVREISDATRKEIELFARSLIAKRQREVEKLLPLTCRYLAEDLRPMFRKFAQAFNPTSTKKHLEDAIEFANFIGGINTIPPCIRDIARFESARLRHYSHGLRTTRCFVRYDLRPLFKSHSSEIPDLSERRSFALWLRLRSRSRFLFL